MTGAARTEESFLRAKQFMALRALLLSLSLVPVVLLPMAVDMAPVWESRLDAVGWVIWSMFVIE